MPQPELHIRAATVADIPFLSLIILEAITRSALDDKGALRAEREQLFERLCTVVQREDTLYSWRHGRLCELSDGTPIAGAVCYDGALYGPLRGRTFDLLRDVLDFDPSLMEDEAVFGQHYLDSLATLPPFRGMGAAGLLMHHWMTQARKLGLTPTLIVFPTNKHAIALYHKMGFRDDGAVFVFGEYYRRFVALP